MIIQSAVSAAPIAASNPRLQFIDGWRQYPANTVCLERYLDIERQVALLLNRTG
jgi:hypothetical protein